MGNRVSRDRNVFEEIVLQRDEEEKYATFLQQWEALQVHLNSMEERIEKKSKKKRCFFRKRAIKEIQRQKEILDGVWDIRDEVVSQMKENRLVAYRRQRNQEKREQIERERKMLEDAKASLQMKVEKIEKREAVEKCKERVKQRKACQDEDEVIEREMAARREKIIWRLGCELQRKGKRGLPSKRIDHMEIALLGSEPLPKSSERPSSVVK
ncbi:meiosis-specific nuclear structural protein 1-like [Ptychodera flava]|uniref:meiosis-specific nuclear structural protein 1-like n=1 Tax=Ptychodera flava TaxID=63121 RepID=UPI00396A92D8